jgi:hypothetical protein
MSGITNPIGNHAADARIGLERLFLSAGEEETGGFDDAEYHQAKPKVHKRPQVELKALVSRRHGQVRHGEEIECIPNKDDDQIPKPT